MGMSDNKYTCAMCHNTYTKEITDEEAMQETQQDFPGTKQEECAAVCDDCWQKIKPEQKIDTFEQHVNKWLRDIYRDSKAVQEQRNFDTLIKTLQEQGHSVHINLRSICVDELSTITIESARTVPVETLVEWVNDNNVRETLRRTQQHGNQECDTQM